VKLKKDGTLTLCLAGNILMELKAGIMNGHKMSMLIINQKSGSSFLSGFFFWFLDVSNFFLYIKLCGCLAL
jgi:hypothetical protein